VNLEKIKKLFNQLLKEIKPSKMPIKALLKIDFDDHGEKSLEIVVVIEKEREVQNDND
jgi:hypothetical protein